MNPILYTKMQGECEFMVGGVLKDWSITDRFQGDYRIVCTIILLIPSGFTW